MSDQCCHTCPFTAARVRAIIRAARQTDTLTEAVHAVMKQYSEKPVLARSSGDNPEPKLLSDVLIAVEIEQAMQSVGTDPAMIARHCCPYGVE